MGGQGVLRGNSAKGDAHDGVDTCCKDIHPSILDQICMLVTDLVSKGKADTLAFTDPVFLHGTHALRPTIQPMLNLIQQFGSVVRNA